VQRHLGLGERQRRHAPLAPGRLADSELDAVNGFHCRPGAAWGPRMTKGRDDPAVLPRRPMNVRGRAGDAGGRHAAADRLVVTDADGPEVTSDAFRGKDTAGWSGRGPWPS
jgi:hypothetical protein